MAEHIQIGDTTPRAQYVADGSQTGFTFPFPIFQPADLGVFLGTTPQTDGYEVSGAGSSSGGTVTFTVPPASGTMITLRRQLPIARTADFQSGGVIRAKTLNDELDYQVAALQQVAAEVSRTVRLSPTARTSPDLTLPEPVPGRNLKWNADGSGLENSEANPDSLNPAAAEGVSFLPAGRGAVMRSVHDKLREFVSVKDFGAKGDGVTDDTAAIQTAIDAADDGAILFFPFGVYPHRELVIAKQLRMEGPGAKGAKLRYTGTGTGIVRQNELENGITNGFDAYDLDFEVGDPAADVTLIAIHGGNSFCRFTQCRFWQTEERTTQLYLTGATGTFIVGETVTGATSGATATIATLAGGSVKLLEDNRRFVAGEVITGGTSAAKGTVATRVYPGQTVGVKFVGSSDPGFGDVFRPSVYGMFDQCEFVNLKMGVKGQYAGYKKFNETVFLDCSFQYVDYALFDGQQASGVKFYGGGIEMWKKTGIYSDGDHYKIFGTRFERGGPATEACYAATFTNTDVDIAANAITIAGHSFRNGDEVVLESPRDAKNRNLVIWPEGLLPGELYYVVSATANTVKLATSPKGAAIDITSQGGTNTYVLRKMVNITWQFGRNSSRMAAVVPHTNIGGGPERYCFDGTNSVQYGLWEMSLDGQTVTLNGVTEQPRKPDTVAKTIKALAGQSADLLQIKDATNTLIGGLSKGGIPYVRRLAQAASGVVAIDADAAAYHVLNTTGNITGMTIAGGAGNQELTLRFSYGGAHTVSLSSASVLLAGGTFSATAAAGRFDVVRLIKDSNSGKWMEISRAMDVR